MRKQARIDLRVECPFDGSEATFTHEQWLGGKLEGTWRCVCGAEFTFTLTGTHKDYPPIKVGEK